MRIKADEDSGDKDGDYCIINAMYSAPTTDGVFDSSYTYNAILIQNVATQFKPV